jgi:hypothetical protein
MVMHKRKGLLKTYKPSYSWQVAPESISMCLPEERTKKPNTEKLKEAIDIVRFLMSKEQDYEVKQKYARAGIELNTILLR